MVVLTERHLKLLFYCWLRRTSGRYRELSFDMTNDANCLACCRVFESLLPERKNSNSRTRKKLVVPSATSSCGTAIQQPSCTQVPPKGQPLVFDSKRLRNLRDYTVWWAGSTGWPRAGRSTT